MIPTSTHGNDLAELQSACKLVNELRVRTRHEKRNVNGKRFETSPEQQQSNSKSKSNLRRNINNKQQQTQKQQHKQKQKQRQSKSNSNSKQSKSNATTNTKEAATGNECGHRESGSLVCMIAYSASNRVASAILFVHP